MPTFGDAGQLFDPFVCPGARAVTTERIGLGVASLVLPLRHLAHVARAAASVDVLSCDTPQEYPAMTVPFEARGRRLREAFEHVRREAEPSPAFDGAFGRLDGGADLLPKPTGGLPMLVTGGGRLLPDWTARRADGWIACSRDVAMQAGARADWPARVEGAVAPPEPVMQPLHVDLDEDPHAPQVSIHLGFRSGAGPLRDHPKGWGGSA